MVADNIFVVRVCNLGSDWSECVGCYFCSVVGEMEACASESGECQCNIWVFLLLQPCGWRPKHGHLVSGRFSWWVSTDERIQRAEVNHRTDESEHIGVEGLKLWRIGNLSSKVWKVGNLWFEGLKDKQPWVEGLSTLGVEGLMDRQPW